MTTYLSIDIGTSSTKLSLYDERGLLLASRSAAYPVDYPRPEWAEQDPQLWWQAVCQLAPHIMSAARDQRLAGISVSGQTPLCVPVSADGHPLRPAILWLDRRASPQVAWLRETIGAARCQEHSPNRLDSYFGGLKWLWFRQNEPELFAQTWKILQANSYIIYHLTGEAVIDPSQAGLCSPCFDFDRRAWDTGLCERMGLPVDLLPAIHPSCQPVGAILPSAAQASGLPAGVPVVCGGGDFACACLGAGVTGPGSAALMLGTAGNLLFPGVRSTDARLLHTIHLTGEPLPFGGVLAGGNLAWFAGLFAGLIEPGSPFFAGLDEEAARVAPGCEGLLFLPYLMGERTPIWDPSARGAFIGLSSHHTRAHLYRAVLEGVAFAFRQIAGIASGPRSGPTAPLNTITAIDGGARSPLWRAILASVLDIPILEGSPRSGTALGSAFLAALGAGDVASFDDITTWVETGSTSQPDPSARRRYDALYPVYAGLYEKLKPDFDHLQIK